MKLNFEFVPQKEKMNLLKQELNLVEAERRKGKTGYTAEEVLRQMKKAVAEEVVNHPKNK